MEPKNNGAEQTENIDLPQTENVEEVQKYTVRHNKADVQLTLEELIQNAEKGLDYDRIRPSHELVKELAAKDGEGDVSRFIAKMKNGKDGETPAAEVPQPERNTALNDKEKEVIAREYPQYVKNGAVELPKEAQSLFESGMSAPEACRALDLRHTKELCARLSARLDAQAANRANAAVSIGSLSGGEAPQKDFYTSQEWDRLPQRDKERFIKNGKIYEFMKKWSGK